MFEEVEHWHQQHTKAPAIAEPNPFSALEDKDSTPSNNPLESINSEASTQEKDPAPSNDPLETSGHSPQTPDADIPDSIGKALLDALQAKWTENNLPPAAIA